MNIITLTGIRPDFIRMSEVFRKLDAEPSVNHILIHTGQHFDSLLSGVFFEELDIRTPDYNLEIGGPGKEHFHQSAELTVKLIELIRKEELDPHWIVFLGDSNSVMIAPSLKKEGYKVAHIEAGMRSRDRRMLEEINRIVCDHSSELLFTYHEDYTENLCTEGIPRHKTLCVGNTIVEVANRFKPEICEKPKKEDFILLDIHRPENFKDPARLQAIFDITQMLSDIYGLPCISLQFPRTYSFVSQFGIDTGSTQPVELMPYKKYLSSVYHAKFLISDSGTAQEEPALFRTPVLVPREFTERPQSYHAFCSRKLHTSSLHVSEDTLRYIDSAGQKMNPRWLGDGRASEKISTAMTRGPQ